MTEAAPPEPPRATQRRGEGLRQVARNPGLLRAIVAYGGFAFAEWTAWIVVLVVAFERGGAGSARTSTSRRRGPSSRTAAS